MKITPVFTRITAITDTADEDCITAVEYSTNKSTHKPISRKPCN